jgi:hypothetical protein
MTRWLLVITWVALIFYHLGFKENEHKIKSVPLGYYEIDYLNGDIRALYIDLRTNSTQEVSVEEVEQNSGMKFPKYREVK